MSQMSGKYSNYFVETDSGIHKNMPKSEGQKIK